MRAINRLSIFCVYISSALCFTSVVHAAGSPLQVYDANGKVVGPLVATGNALFTFKNGQQRTVQVNAGGFLQANIQALSYLHTSADCSGQRYLVSSLPVGVVIYNETLYFPLPPFANMTTQSFEIFSTGDNVSQPGRCIGNQNSSYFVGKASSAPLSTLGNFVPPFSVK